MYIVHVLIELTYLVLNTINTLPTGGSKALMGDLVSVIKVSPI